MREQRRNPKRLFYRTFFTGDFDIFYRRFWHFLQEILTFFTWDFDIFTWDFDIFTWDWHFFTGDWHFFTGDFDIETLVFSLIQWRHIIPLVVSFAGRNLHHNIEKSQSHSWQFKFRIFWVMRFFFAYLRHV